MPCVPIPENATSFFFRDKENLRLQLEKKQREVQAFDGRHAKLGDADVAQHAGNCILTTG